MRWVTFRPPGAHGVSKNLASGLSLDGWPGPKLETGCVKPRSRHEPYTTDTVPTLRACNLRAQK